MAALRGLGGRTVSVPQYRPVDDPYMPDPFATPRGAGSQGFSPLPGMPTMASLLKPPTKTELAEQAAVTSAERAALLDQDAQNVITQIQAQPRWAEGTTKFREDWLEKWNTDIWPSFAEQQWGKDAATNEEAQAFKYKILNPLRQQIQEQSAVEDGFMNALTQSIPASVQRGVGGLDVGLASAGVTIDEAQNRYYESRIAGRQEANAQLLAWAGDDPDKKKAIARKLAANDADSADLMQRLSENYQELKESQQSAEQAISRASGVERINREMYPSVRSDARRLEELAQARPDRWDITNAFTDSPSTALSYVSNLTAEQIPNALAISVPSLVTGGAGSLLGAGLGRAATVGATVLSSATLAETQVAGSAYQEVMSMPSEQVATLPEYKALMAQDGMTDEQARTALATDAAYTAAKTYVPFALVTSLFGPEAMLARTALGTAGRAGVLASAGRVAVSGLSESGEEGAQQLAQNIGFTEATGSERSLAEGVAENAVVGGLLGLIWGSPAALNVASRNMETRTVNDPATGTPLVDPVTGQTVVATPTDNGSGFTLGLANEEGKVTPFDTTPIDVNATTAKLAEERTEYTRTVYKTIQEMRDDTKSLTQENVDATLNNIYEASVRGADPKNVDMMLANLHLVANADNKLGQVPVVQNFKQLTKVKSLELLQGQHNLDSPAAVVRLRSAERVAVINAINESADPQQQTQLNLLLDDLNQQINFAQQLVDQNWEKGDAATIRSARTRGASSVAGTSVSNTSQPQTTATDVSAAAISGSDGDAGTVNGAPPGTGASGTTYAGAGAAQSNVQSAQPVGTAGPPVNDGRTDTAATSASAGPDTGVRSTDGQSEQRAVDGSSTAAVSPGQDGGSGPVSNDFATAFSEWVDETNQSFSTADRNFVQSKLNDLIAKEASAVTNNEAAFRTAFAEWIAEVDVLLSATDRNFAEAMAEAHAMNQEEAFTSLLQVDPYPTSIEEQTKLLRVLRKQNPYIRNMEEASQLMNEAVNSELAEQNYGTNFDSVPVTEEEQAAILGVAPTSPGNAADLSADQTRLNDAETNPLADEIPPEPELREMTSEEIEAAQDSANTRINTLFEASGLTADGFILRSPDGTYSVADDWLPPEWRSFNAAMAELLARRAEVYSEAREIARLNRERHLRRWARSAPGASRIAGRWQKLTTFLGQNLVSQLSPLETYINFMAPTTRGDYDSGAATQAIYRMPSRMNAARDLIIDGIITPMEARYDVLAERLGIDVDLAIQDFSLAHTLRHVIESEPRMRQRLLTDVENAYTQVVGPQLTQEEKDAAIRKAEKRLAQYIEWQTPPEALTVEQSKVPRVRRDTYGGWAIWEAEKRLSEIVKKYSQGGRNGEAVVAEGIQISVDAINSITTTAYQNGLIDDEWVGDFRDDAFYAPLYTPRTKGLGAENDLHVISPNMMRHRGGSTTPAMNAYEALQIYASRTAFGMGATDVGQQLNSLYNHIQRQIPAIEQAIASGGLTPAQSQQRQQLLSGMKGFVRTNITDSFRMISRLREAGVINEAEARGQADALRRNADLTVRVLEDNIDPKTKQPDGTQKVVLYSFGFDENHKGQSEALRSLVKTEKAGWVEARAKSITKLLGSTYTYMRLGFPPVSATKDFTERIFYMPGRTYLNANGEEVSGWKVAARTAAYFANPMNHVRNIRATITKRAGRKGPAPGASKFFDRKREFDATGISYSLNRLLSNESQKMQAEVKARMHPSLLKRFGGLLFGRNSLISRYAEHFYEMPMVAQYNAMRDIGITPTDAADNVRALMDMRQSGRVTNKLAALWPFMSSQTQSSNQMLRALGLHSGWGTANPNMVKSAAKGWAMLTAGIVSLSMLIPFIREALGRDDDGQYILDKIPLGLLSGFIPLPTGNGKAFVEFPTGFGIPAIAATIAYGIDRAQRSRISPADLGFALTASMTKNLIPNSTPAFNFSQDPGAFILQVVTPSWAAPITQVATNTTYAGGKINYQSGVASADQRRSDMGQAGTAQVWKDCVQLIYNATGGVLDLTPEGFRHVFNGYMGGVLQGIPMLMEKGDAVKVPGYQNQRDELGVVGTVLGLQTFYTPEVKRTNGTFYQTLDEFNQLIRRAGMHDDMTGSPSKKPNDVRAWQDRQLAARGFSDSWRGDYFRLKSAEKEISNLNSRFKARLEQLHRSNMDGVDMVQAAALKYQQDKEAIQLRTLRTLNYTQDNYQRTFRLPDPEAAKALREN